MFRRPHVPQSADARIEATKSTIDELIRGLWEESEAATSEAATEELQQRIGQLNAYLDEKQRDLKSLREQQQHSDQLVNNQQASNILSSVYGLNGKVAGIVLSKAQKADDAYDPRELRSLMAPTRNRSVVSIGSLQAANPELSFRMHVAALANPAHNDTYVIHAPVKEPFFGCAVFVDQDVSRETLADRVDGFCADAVQGHYSFIDAAILLRRHGLHPRSRAYVPLVTQNMSMTDGGAFDKDSVAAFMGHIEDYTFLNYKDHQREIDFVLQNGTELARSVAGDCFIAPAGVVMVKKGYEEHWANAIQKEAENDDRYPQPRFSYRPGTDSVTIGDRRYQLHDTIDTESLLEMACPDTGERAHERLRSILPEEVDTEDALHNFIPLLQTHYLFDERKDELRRRTGLSDQQVIQRMYQHWDKGYRGAGIVEVYGNGNGRILAYPIHYEDRLQRLLTGD